MMLGFVITNDKPSCVAKEDSICLFSVAKKATLNEQWIKPGVALYIFDHCPNLILAFITFVVRIERASDATFINLDGMSLFTVDLFVFIIMIFLSTSATRICGMRNFGKSGFVISSSFR